MEDEQFQQYLAKLSPEWRDWVERIHVAQVAMSRNKDDNKHEEVVRTYLCTIRTCEKEGMPLDQEWIEEMENH